MLKHTHLMVSSASCASLVLVPAQCRLQGAFGSNGATVSTWTTASALYLCTRS